MTNDSTRNLRPAVFLDRDGTINHERNYLHKIDDFELIPGIPEALQKLQNAGFLLVVVTNQSGVARGYFSLQDVKVLNDYMCLKLAEYGVKFDGIYICPHHPTAGIGEYLLDCNCRKGKPGMLQQAARDLAIDLKRSYMVGDKVSDAEAGNAAGCRSVLVQTGYGTEQKKRSCLLPYPSLRDLSEAADYIVNDFKRDKVDHPPLGTDDC